MNFEGEFTLEPDGERVIPVYFAPADAGGFNGQLTVASNDPNQGEVQIDLAGRAELPAQDITLSYTAGEDYDPHFEGYSIDDYFDGDVSFAGTDNIIVDISAGGPFASSYTLMTWTGSESGTPSLVLPDNWTWNSDTWQTDNKIVVTVPEPTTLVLVLIGMGTYLGITRKKRRLS